MAKQARTIAAVLVLTLLPTLFIWLPFFLRIPQFWNMPIPQAGMATVVANYDGPLYIVVAKTLYNVQAIKDAFSFPLPVEYYAAHFPLYPLLIRAIGGIFTYPYAMLAVTVASSFFALWYFYLLARTITPKQAMYLTAVFAVFPGRWLIVRSVGSPEPLYIAGILASLYYFREKKYWLAGIAGAIAQLTKSPGILLFIAYGCALVFPRLQELATKKSSKWIKTLEFRAYPVILIPAALVGVFGFYALTMNNFFAYFSSGDNIHLFFPPFQIFNYSAPWVNTHWLEEIIFIYIVGALGVLKLFQKKLTVLAWFVAVFFTVTLFVSHRDLMRYSLPIAPVLLLAYEDTITKKEFKYVMALILIPLYLFSIAFISNNAMPISDWSPFL